MIAHVDIDAFFASVAERANPALRGQAVAVSRDSRRAVVLTASYEARKYGVRSAMPLYIALQRCPHLLIVDPQPELYRALSRQIFALIEHDGFPFESLSLDEGYIDLRDMPLAAAVAHVEGLRARIAAATALTVSAGIGGSKLIAKIASDLAKPDGLRAIAAGTEVQFLRDLGVARLPGVGPKLAVHLEGFAIFTIGQVADLAPERAAEIFGRSARAYHDLAHGIDSRSVIPERLRKSLSTESTFEHNLLGDAQIVPILREQAQEVAAALAARGLRAATIGLKIKRTDFTVRSRQTHLREPTANERIIFAAARFCWRTSGFATIPLRLVGLRAADLWNEGPAQLALW